MEKNKITLQDIIKVRQLVDDINASYSFMETWNWTGEDFYLEVYLDQFCMYWWRQERGNKPPKKIKLMTTNDISDLLWRLERLAESLNDQVWRVVMG